MLLPIAWIIAGSSGVLFLILFFYQFRKTRQLEKSIREKEEQIGSLNEELRFANDQLKSVDQIRESKDDMVSIKQGFELTLKKALKRSEEENFQKNTFLSNLSSEIRTPLNNIIGFASLLETETSLLENKELFEYARGISESGDRLINILNNIIDISRIESHDVEVNLKPCQLAPIISNVAQLYIFKANDQKIKFNVINKDIPEALTDDKILTHVLGGIVDNAIKFTEKGFVNISTDFNSKTGQVSVRVKDSGSGIDPAYLTDIFNPFRKDGPGYNKEVQGTRLGLPIARRLVEMMDASIEIESEKGRGTTVTVSMKASGIPEEAATDESAAEPGTTSSRKTNILKDLDIFIVEDDLMNSMVLVQMTKSLGTVTTAVNGESTLKILANREASGKRFDIMLFDINLPPPYDGINLMQKIRKMYPAYTHIPFVAQTAYAMTGDREKLLDAGFDDYISKPINKNELYTIIKNQLKIH